MSPSESGPQNTTLDLSVVIPIYNERENLVALEEKLNENLPNLNLNYEVVLVDDGSLDGSDQLIRSLKKQNASLRLIRFVRNFGQSAAFIAGFRAARGRIIVTMDADLQNDPADIPLLLEKIEEFDVVCGWRHKRNDPWIKKISSKIANAVRNKLSDETISDTGCSLKAFRRECFDKIILFNGMHRFFPTLVKMEGFSVTEVKVSHHSRLHGKSKYNIRNRLWSSLKDLLAVRWLKKRRMIYDIIEED
ncbi:MAG: glycosyl transferase [Nitrospinaceae bacterium]|nr:MAG: glycosyl transferase [Nitrospinaceae bacterium]